MIIIVAFGWLIEVNMGELWDNVLEMLYHIVAFIFTPYFCLTVTETGMGLLEWFPYYCPSHNKENESAHWEVFKIFQVLLFCWALQF